MSSLVVVFEREKIVTSKTIQQKRNRIIKMISSEVFKYPMRIFFFVIKNSNLRGKYVLDMHKYICI